MSAVAIRNDGIVSGAAFKAVMFYDDIGYASQAATSLERTLCTGEETTWDVKSWRLDALWEPTQVAITTAIAADSNLIVFALSDTHPPLDGLLNWLERWSANRRVKDAAVTLLDSLADAGAPLHDELERFARRHGLTFLDAGQAWHDEGLASGTGRQRLRHPLGIFEPPPLVEPEPAPDHWGIND